MPSLAAVVTVDTSVEWKAECLGRVSRRAPQLAALAQFLHGNVTGGELTRRLHTATSR